jgi:hypothetical protein
MLIVGTKVIDRERQHGGFRKRDLTGPRGQKTFYNKGKVN